MKGRSSPHSALGKWFAYLAASAENADLTSMFIQPGLHLVWLPAMLTWREWPGKSEGVVFPSLLAQYLVHGVGSTRSHVSRA